MRAKMLGVAPADAVDVVGTGGDASGSSMAFNLRCTAL
jgi:hypothetical protein